MGKVQRSRSEEQLPKVERKTKQKWMTDILDFMEKRRQVKNK